jgi:hypothetical protein
MLSILLVGILLTIRSIEAVYQKMSDDDIYIVRCMGLCGFLLGNFGNLHQYLSPWTSLLPISVILVREIFSLQPNLGIYDSGREYSRHELLSVRRRMETELSPDILGIRSA